MWTCIPHQIWIVLEINGELRSLRIPKDPLNVEVPCKYRGLKLHIQYTFSFAICNEQYSKAKARILRPAFCRRSMYSLQDYYITYLCTLHFLSKKSVHAREWMRASSEYLTLSGKRERKSANGQTAAQVARARKQASERRAFLLRVCYTGERNPTQLTFFPRVI